MAFSALGTPWAAETPKPESNLRVHLSPKEPKSHPFLGFLIVVSIIYIYIIIIIIMYVPIYIYKNININIFIYLFGSLNR